MAVVSLVCSQCGGKVNLDADGEFGVCSFCGTQMMLQNESNTTINNVYKKIYTTGDGKDYQNLIDDGIEFLDLNQIKMANSTFKKAIEKQPRNWRGWAGYALSGGERNNLLSAYQTAFECAQTAEDREIIFDIMCEHMRYFFDRGVCDFAIAMRPNDWRGWFALEHGRLEGPRKELIKAYKLAIKSKDENAAVLIAKHTIYQKKFGKKQSRYRFRRALREMWTCHKKIAKMQIKQELKAAKPNKRNR